MGIENVKGATKVVVPSGGAIEGSKLQELETKLKEANVKLEAAPKDWSVTSKNTRAQLTMDRDVIAAQIAKLKGSPEHQATAQNAQSSKPVYTAPKVDPKVATESRILSQLRMLGVPYNGSGDPKALGSALYDRTLGRIGTDEQFTYRALELAHSNGTTSEMNAALGERLKAAYPGIDQRPEIKSNPKDGYIRFLIASEMQGSEAQRALDFLEKGADQFHSSGRAYVGEGMLKTFDSMGDALHDKPLQAGAMMAGGLVVGAAVTVAAPVVAAGAGLGMLAYAGAKLVKNAYEAVSAKTPEEKATNLVEMGGAISETAMASLAAPASIHTLKTAASAAGKAGTVGGKVTEFLAHGSKLKGLLHMGMSADDTAVLADKLHADWQATARAAGKTERFKAAKINGAQVEIKDAAELPRFLDSRGVPKNLQGHYRLVDGKLEEDILKLPNRLLSPNNAAENNASAKVVAELINQQLKAGGKLDDPAFIHTGGDKIHVEWMNRNKSWAPADQMLPFDKLTPAEAQKDTDMLLQGIKLFLGAK